MPAMVTAYMKAISNLIYELPSSGRLVQSLLYRALSAESRELARELHRLSRDLKLGSPYSVTRLTTAREYVKGRLASVPRGGEVRATFKLLRDEFVDPLLDGLVKAELEINGTEVEVAEIKVGRKGYEDLLLRSPIVSGVTFRLITNTILDGEFPPPLPHLLKRPLEAWNFNAPEHLALPDTLEKRMYLAEPADPTWMREAVVEIWFGNERVVREGWLGEISYSLRGLDSYIGRMVSALARFSEFSGLGRRTSMGFGVVSVRFRRGRRKRGKEKKEQDMKGNEIKLEAKSRSEDGEVEAK